MKRGLPVDTLERPRRYVAEVLVVAHGLSLGGLVLHPEVCAAGLVTVEGVSCHELTELEEVRNTARLFQLLVQVPAAARDDDVLPKLGPARAPQRGGLFQGLFFS